MSVRRLGLALAACLSFLFVPVLSASVLAQQPSKMAQAQQQSQQPQARDAEATFHRAYFLERERGHLEEALALYEAVAASREASAALQGEARARAAAVREDVATVDLARLMPPETIVYAETSQPGQALTSVLTQLGLVGSFQEAAAKGGFTLDPGLVQGLLGIRGCAVALTRIPMGGGTPGGVLVVNAGDMRLLRGAIEAGVLSQGTPAEPIEGLPSWTVHGHLHVAVGERVVIASDARAEIAGVVRRMRSQEEPSLASNEGLATELAKRTGSPFYLCVNAQPLRPLLAGLLSQPQSDPSLRLATAALDPDGLRSFVARLVVGEDGVALEADLYLENDHKNLAFNLLRGAAIDPVLLEQIPEGVAAFATGAFNARGPAIARMEENSGGVPAVSALDFGRELFANLAGFALFVVPGGAPLPSAALVLSSNDPARTQAVLGLVLGLAGAATGGSLEGEAVEIAGSPARVWRLPPGIPLYLATRENTLILSPSEDLIEEAFEARGNGQSVLNDEAFAAELGRLGKDTTMALCAHLGRTLATAQPFLPSGQRQELARFAPLLERTVVALTMRHSGSQLGLALAMHGLPRIDGLVGQVLRAQRQGGAVAASSGAGPDVVVR
jgi:hypothetical protein